MNSVQSEIDIIHTWINSLGIDFKKSPILTTLPENTIINLLQNLIIFFSSNNKKPLRGKSITSLKKGNKITLQVKVNQPGFESILETYFYKKKINSNWTYLRYRHYKIKWNVNIHLIAGSSKAYQVNNKKKIIKKESTEKESRILFTDYFDKESDDES